jgi:hypothetical protein
MGPPKANSADWRRRKRTMRRLPKLTGCMSPKANEATPGRESCDWMRGQDLNLRPLGYESEWMPLRAVRGGPLFCFFPIYCDEEASAARITPQGAGHALAYR